ncbi:MFS transporter [Streptomyces sp. NPDC059637]|uniref:MFS transporter n=1 Tax=Streptomyces sp. NPDC059637 TaxID=3347752 RepID=UPI0036A3B472
MRIHAGTTVVAALVSSLVVGAGTVAAAAPGRAAPASSTSNALPAAVREAVRFELPRPTGRHAVGVTELHLVDRDRPDPWVAGADRELMVGVWYPARSARGYPRQPYMPPGVARHADESGSFGLTRPGEVDWASAMTDTASAAPADDRTARPVVLYSPGLGDSRAFGTSAAVELASRGYVVVTVDHTHECAAVEFPGGRVEFRKPPTADTPTRRKAIETRVHDIRFVLDRLAVLGAGGNPDAGKRRLPHGLGRALDLERVGMYGHSAGGITAAEAMRTDSRIDAGINMDGTLQYTGTEFLRGTATSMGGVLWPLLAGVVGGISWHLPFGVYLLGVPLGIATALLLPRGRPNGPGRPAGEGPKGWEVLRRHRILLARYGLQFCGSLLLYALVVFLPQRLAEAGVGDPLPVSLYTVGMSGAMSLIGLAYARLRARLPYSVLLRGAPALWTAAFLLLAVAPNAPLLFLAPLLFGLGQGVFFPVTTVLIGEGVPAAVRGQATSLSGTATFAGQFASPLLIGPLIQATSLTTGFLLAAAVPALALAALWISRAGATGPRPGVPAPSPAPAPASRTE